MTLSLLRQHSPLALPSEQRRVLQASASPPLAQFDDLLKEHGLAPLRASAVSVLQVNLGKLCNQTCSHCHVDAGPDRREIMSRETMTACLRFLERSEMATVDITGGAPELNPHFRWFVEELRRFECHIIDRCNLTILVAPGYYDLPRFLADNQVEIVASLPCYLADNVDRQRGDGVFERSLTALRILNQHGFGTAGSGRILTLVYNPVGPVLPPEQSQLEADYRRELSTRYGIVFTRLHTITNMPISRFLDDLLQSGEYQAYIDKLIGAFNPTATESLMCRNTISVDWQGHVFDCDFNQMLELGLTPELPRHISELNAAQLTGRRISTGRHCFGCTAGAGSSCRGALIQ